MKLYEKIIKKQDYISVIGLGYVGLPIAIAFAKKVNVIGFDISKKKINLYKKGVDVTKEIGEEELLKTTINFTNKENDLKKAKFHIVAVPTPVNNDKTPDLTPLISASKILAKNLNKGSIVVYESTVYPGVTEEVCLPILEKISGLKHGVDFKIGYSPERINPGDKLHTLENIIKVVSGSDHEALEIISSIYKLVVKAGVHRAESIKVAEAAKVIENSQRDINIAFMNELSIIFNKMNINTGYVLKAARTKWNFLNFSPGLVGGHCIGVDPYYLTYKAEQLGYHSQIILSGRRINDGMGKYIAENTVKKMINAGMIIQKSKVAIFGLTFKEDCPDIRNTKVIDIINELKEYDIDPIIYDPEANVLDAKDEYNIEIVNENEIKNVDAIIFAVAHNKFKKMKLQKIEKYYKNKESRVLVDVKSIFEKEKIIKNGYHYFNL